MDIRRNMTADRTRHDPGRFFSSLDSCFSKSKNRQTLVKERRRTLAGSWAAVVFLFAEEIYRARPSSSSLLCSPATMARFCPTTAPRGHALLAPSSSFAEMW
ncbi:hypothetical protein BDA96_02G106600 [Sorghum bicolor]|uniref:Uncharacterized protein n=1 Tax=Sorghum bicolor TaxID=4558 RepID=A0A921RMR3_SORBI|nr:hypothetical protein BDA96_02G106600 [Sorghum bicolor]